MVLQVTPSALSVLRRVLEREPAARGFRLWVEAGGCAGLSYRLSAVASGAPDDIHVQIENLSFWVPTAHIPFLEGLTLDHPEGLADRGFVFQNPQARSTCGCGTSFAV